MPTYKLGNLYVEAKDKEEALAINKVLKDKSKKEKLILLRKGGKNFIIPIPEDGNVDVFFKKGDTVSYCGSVEGGVGNKILQSAIDNVNITRSEAGKVAANLKSMRVAKGHLDDAKTIEGFESSLPQSVKPIYDDIMFKIEATTIAYKLEVVLGVREKGVEKIDAQSWLPALTWFKDKVLSDADFSNTRRLRQSFITALVRIVGGGAKNSTTMKRVVESHDDDYWSKYAEGDTGS